MNYLTMCDHSHTLNLDVSGGSNQGPTKLDTNIYSVPLFYNEFYENASTTARETSAGAIQDSEHHPCDKSVTDTVPQPCGASRYVTDNLCCHVTSRAPCDTLRDSGTGSINRNSEFSTSSTSTEFSDIESANPVYVNDVRTEKKPRKCCFTKVMAALLIGVVLGITACSLIWLTIDKFRSENINCVLQNSLTVNNEKTNTTESNRPDFEMNPTEEPQHNKSAGSELSNENSQVDSGITQTTSTIPRQSNTTGVGESVIPTSTSFPSTKMIQAEVQNSTENISKSTTVSVQNTTVSVGEVTTGPVTSPLASSTTNLVTQTTTENAFNPDTTPHSGQEQTSTVSGDTTPLSGTTPSFSSTTWVSTDPASTLASSSEPVPTSASFSESDATPATSSEPVPTSGSFNEPARTSASSNEPDAAMTSSDKPDTTVESSGTDSSVTSPSNHMPTAAGLSQTTSDSGITSGGHVYVRWGRSGCPDSSNMLYSGFAAGGHYIHSGGAASSLCLPTTPTWGAYSDGLESDRNLLHVTEYESTNTAFNTLMGRSLHDENVPCAVCQATGRPNHVMIPGRVACLYGWHQEYTGYLMGGSFQHPHGKSVICVDQGSQPVPGRSANENGNLLYFVEFRGTNTEHYVNGRELSCVVCTL